MAPPVPLTPPASALDGSASGAASAASAASQPDRKRRRESRRPSDGSYADRRRDGGPRGDNGGRGTSPPPLPPAKHRKVPREERPPPLVIHHVIGRLRQNPRATAPPRSAQPPVPPPKPDPASGEREPRPRELKEEERLARALGGDGRRSKRGLPRRTVDCYASITRHLEIQYWVRDHREYPALRPDANFVVDMLPPAAMVHKPIEACATKFVHTSTNKVRCPVNAVRWTPEGRRLITGCSTGEFTLWNGMTFNFETILQAHDVAVRAMRWSHNDNWLVSADHNGVIKYWQSNMNNLKMFQGHREAIRDLSFSPTDSRFATASDDSTIKIWNFQEGMEDRTLTGHGWDVKCVDWHPYKSLLASGSKDNLVKLWDPKMGKVLTTLHGHKNTVQTLQWNRNGNWLATGARDQLIKVFDIRVMKELQIFRGHKKEVCSMAWHPHHERLLASGGSDGAIVYWQIGLDGPVAGMDGAHESFVWSMDWHPLGHILVSGSNDHMTRFWTRPRPAEMPRGKEEQKEAAEAEAAAWAGESWGEDDEMFVPGLTSVFGMDAMSFGGYGPPGKQAAAGRYGSVQGATAAEYGRGYPGEQQQHLQAGHPMLGKEAFGVEARQGRQQPPRQQQQQPAASSLGPPSGMDVFDNLSRIHAGDDGDLSALPGLGTGVHAERPAGGQPAASPFGAFLARAAPSSPFGTSSGRMSSSSSPFGASSGRGPAPPPPLQHGFPAPAQDRFSNHHPQAHLPRHYQQPFNIQSPPQRQRYNQTQH